MIRAGRNLLTGCLLLFFPLLLSAGGNSLLIPAASRCLLDQLPEAEAEQMLQQCETLAGEGDSEAQYELGEYYYQQSADNDFEDAVLWLEKASLQGHPRAQLRLGQMLWRGEGMAVNRIQAWIVFKVAEVNGSDDAMDQADILGEEMNRDELEHASRVLGEIFREYLQQLDQFGPDEHQPQLNS